MMRALFSGVSGLKSHQTRMDVIGNNIANVNTTGFKAKRLNFADMLYQTTQAGTASNTDTMRGGVNPRQIGLGVKTGAINTSITTEGASQSTGNPFDLKLTGEAFFIVSDGTNTFYTRDGSFDVDDAGYLVMANTGYTVLGWTLPETAENDENAIIVQGGTVSPINVKAFTSFNSGSTKGAYFSGIVDKNDKNLLTDTGRQVNLQFYDKMGYEYNLKFGIKPVPNPGESTRDVTTQEYYYGFSTTVSATMSADDKYIYTVDDSNITYKKITGVDTDDEKSVDYKSSSIAGLDEAINELAKRAHEPGKETPQNDPIIITTTVSGNRMTIKCVDKDGNVISDLGGELKETISISTQDKDYAFTNWNNARIEARFDGRLGYSTSPNGDPLIDISEETLTAILGGTPPGVVTNPDDPAAPKAKLPNLRVTEKRYTDETGAEQVQRTVEVQKVDGAGTGAAKVTYDDITNKIEYSDLSQLLKVVDPLIMPSETTTETISAGGYMPGEYDMTLLGMTDSTGVAVDISNLGDVTYDLVYNTDNGLFSYVGAAGNDSFTLNLSALNAEGNFDNLTIDMSDTKNVDNEGKCTLEGLRNDGRKEGTWTGVTISNDGTVTVNYSNGMTRDIAQIAVATFGNAMGLENSGDNLYKESQSSGEPSVVDIVASGTGYMTSGVLEMSNVDLSQEFTEMITTQRGFQANSRIITTSDSILEELVNLKR